MKSQYSQDSIKTASNCIFSPTSHKCLITSYFITKNALLFPMETQGAVLEWLLLIMIGFFLSCTSDIIMNKGV